MAEAILKHKQHPNLEVKSAGVFAGEGFAASPFALKVLLEKGIEHPHLSNPLTEDLIQWATHILTMTNHHKSLIINQFPHAEKKTFLLREFVRGDINDISDPYGGSIEVYRKTLAELEDLIEEFVNNEENL